MKSQPAQISLALLSGRPRNYSDLASRHSRGTHQKALHASPVADCSAPAKHLRAKYSSSEGESHSTLGTEMAVSLGAPMGSYRMQRITLEVLQEMKGIINIYRLVYCAVQVVVKLSIGS